MTTTPVALVTGATSGIAKATAIALAEAAFQVIGTSRNTARVAPGERVTFIDLDVSSDESVAAGIHQVIERFGRIDVLVNNAGIGAAGAAEESSIAQAPYAAVYAATKHAIEGYSESMDHEVREHGVRVLLVEPAYTKTGFDTNLAQPDTPLQIYAAQRRIADEILAATVASGDDPAVVANVIVTAATDAKPKLRYTAGPLAGRVTTLRRIAPARTFDRQIRKINRLAG
jgi:NAD(P)-dependent dehydrogenase (short-subunit alcohol dehydrogenase family)